MKAQTGIKLSDSIKQAIEALKSDSTAAKVRNDAITHLYEAMAAVQSDFESNKAGLPPLPEPLLHNGYRQPGPNQYARPESGFTAGQIQAYAVEYGEAKVVQAKREALSDAIKNPCENWQNPKSGPEL